MAWLVWLAIPVVLTVLAALWAWWRARPAKQPDAVESMAAHRAYLDALTVPARGTARVGGAGADD